MSRSHGNDVFWHLQKQPPGVVQTVERLKSSFHISMKTHDKHPFEISIELNLELTKLGLHWNGGCEIIRVVQTLQGDHIVGFNVSKFVLK